MRSQRVYPIVLATMTTRLKTRPLPPIGTAWRAMLEAKREASATRAERKQQQREAAHQHEIELYKRTVVTPQTRVHYEGELHRDESHQYRVS